MSKLIISEPWDFENTQGGNELSGCILKRLDPKTLLFKTEDEVTLKGVSSRYWLLSARYEKQSFEDEPYQVTINGSLLPEMPSEDDSLSKLKQSSIFVIIGSLQI